MNSTSAAETTRSVLAIAAHPDDIEFVMAGTLLHLAQRGWQIHYFNIANGCCGSTTLSREEAAALRLRESQTAAEMLSASFYAPICDDFDIFYSRETIAQVSAVVRQAKPTIVLTHSPVDYMEDHQNAARLAVGGAFSRGMPNYFTQPPIVPFDSEIAVYHAQPHGNRSPVGEPIRPTHFVDVTEWIGRKRELLSAHASQAQWLDATQKLSSYLTAMEELNREVGQFSGRFEFAEGWRQHLHLGLSNPGFDPLRDALGGNLHCESPT